jgi:hypothetical protein
MLQAAVAKHGQRWGAVRADPEFALLSQRSPSQLRAKYYNISSSAASATTAVAEINMNTHHVATRQGALTQDIDVQPSITGEHNHATTVSESSLGADEIARQDVIVIDESSTSSDADEFEHFQDL